MKKNPANKQKSNESGHCRSGKYRHEDSGFLSKGRGKSITVKMDSEGTVGRQKEDRQNQNYVQLKGKYLLCLYGA